jgi:hypothetical protein
LFGKDSFLADWLALFTESLIYGGQQCVSRILLSALFGSTASLEHDVVIDREDIRKRKKKASKKFRDAYAALD